MKEILAIIPLLLNLITPKPEFKNIRLERKELKLEKKKLRIAERMYKQIHKEFKKDGFDEEESKILDELRLALLNRKLDLIK